MCTPRPLPDDALTGCREPTRFIPHDSIAYGYDAVNLRSIRSSLWQVEAGVGTNAWQYTYDRKDRLTRFDVPKVSGWIATSRTWDDQDHLRAQRGLPNLPLDTVAVDVLGRTIARYDPQATTYAFDALGQLQGVGGDRTDLLDTFTYDSAGNRRTDKRWTFNYDSFGQLQEKDETSGACLLTYEYDASGNQVRQGWAANNPCDTELYRQMFYDVANRMDSMLVVPTGPGTIARRYWYDGLGRRIIMRSNDGTTTAGELGTWRYYWIGDDVFAQTRSGFAEQDWNGLARVAIARDTAGRLEGVGQWFLNAPGVDNPLATWNKSESGERRLFFEDLRGNVAVSTDERGGMASTATQYQAFGAGGGASAGQPGFQGQQSAGGLVYMRNRWYDPNTGRFTQQDPIGFGGGINLYAYAGNDPVNYSDPFGLRACDPPGSCKALWIAAGTAIGAGVGVVTAGGCAAGSGGICLAGAPMIVTAGAGLGGAVGGLVGTAAEMVSDDALSTSVEMGKVSRNLGKWILIGLGALNPNGPKAVPQDARKINRRGSPDVEQESKPEKKKDRGGAGDPSPDPQ